MSILRLFRDGSILEYGRGHFDAQQVYHSRPNALSLPAQDSDILSRVKVLAQSAAPQTIYADFVVIYNRTSRKLLPANFDLIHYMAPSYNEHALEFEIIFAILYAKMVTAEMLRRNPLKRRSKRLGVHLVLFDDYTGTAAAKACQSEAWSELDAACRERGF
ncbi:MAG: hypothetical protein EI684_22615 [Candidatus Viridilinea halotolerans]|uniref:Uncharacterized protein n=1 Tax=Candidatus Viridilinea halotolerans TaxID=2491704 RepID=A0A426TQN8_9CHLR|nr:MAG: hypothetical protein EI684_22615 [Candidatus Viridilinea halotolerans]